jgi:hypothetical protein
MISGRFARNAKEKIVEKARGKAVFFLEGSDIENLETGGSPPRSAKEVAELERLYREALAASRTRTELALSVFEQKLHEIDLLASCSPQDRVETFDRLGFEVSLNSDSQQGNGGSSNKGDCPRRPHRGCGQVRSGAEIL